MMATVELTAESAESTKKVEVVESVVGSVAKGSSDFVMMPSAVVGDSHRRNPKSDGDQVDHDESSDDMSASSKSTAAASMKSEGSPLLLVLPWMPSLRHGCDPKCSARSVAPWVALALSLDGRDKLTKVAQYVSRLLAWWWAGQRRSMRFLDLKNSLTTSRKAFRLGRTFIELHRLQSLGLLASWRWHLAHARWLPLRSLLPYGGSGGKVSSDPAPCHSPLELLGSTVKLLGLAGFWAADNVSFLVQSGVWDNYAVSPEIRRKQRLRRQSQASRWANRSYFMGAVAGLLVSAKAYLHHRTQKMLPTVDGVPEGDAVQDEVVWDRAREKQFALFVALLKSCCDVLVFSNNPGLDLWRKHSGKPLHEGLHCLCGLASAATVLYNSFPNDSKSKP